MTNSWAMLFDYKYGEDRPQTDDATGITEFPEETFNFVAAQPVMLGGAAGEDTLCFDFINPGGEKVVITDDPKDNTFSGSMTKARFCVRLSSILLAPTTDTMSAMSLRFRL